MFRHSHHKQYLAIRDSFFNEKKSQLPRKKEITEAVQDLQKHGLGSDRLLNPKVQISAFHQLTLKQGKELQGYLTNSYST